VPLQVELVTPERVLYTGEAEMVVARTTDGEIGIMAGHVPLLAALAPGRVKIFQTDGGEEVAAVHSGFMEMDGQRLIILSDVAELASQIDVDRARRAKERAEERTRTEDDAEAQAALTRAVVRIDVADSA
jgi:F-type H+-transporting ATPase subunit epsilon